jgi:hypothetical protein
METLPTIKPNRTLLAKVLGSTGVGFMVLTAYIQLHYADVSPTLPDEISGQVHVLNVHGRIVYLDTMQRDKLYLCEAGAIVFGLGFAATVILSPRPTRP